MGNFKIVEKILKKKRKNNDGIFLSYIKRLNMKISSITTI